MIRITLRYEPIRNLLADPELNKFRKTLADRANGPILEPFLDALDRPDVVLNMISTPAAKIPGIVPACIVLKGNRAFETGVVGNDYLKKCLGTLTKIRAQNLGLATTGKKGRVSSWMPGITVAEIYRFTPTVESVVTFNPSLPKGMSIFSAGLE